MGWRFDEDMRKKNIKVNGILKGKQVRLNKEGWGGDQGEDRGGSGLEGWVREKNSKSTGSWRGTVSKYAGKCSSATMTSETY